MNSAEPLPITILLGPTASGKTSLSLEIARRAGTEIITADSMQIYRGMDIGTAKPSPEEQAEVPHHLIDICEPWERFNVADFVRRADEAAEKIHSSGLPLLMSGGSALYLKGFIEGIFEAAAYSAEVREQLIRETREVGVWAMHERMARVDPEAGLRIHANDLRRIVRALEVYELTGKPISDWQVQEGQERSGYRFRIFGLRLPREQLYERINMRVQDMIARGLVEEVQQLMERGRGMGDGALQALGYRDMVAHLRGEMELDIAINETKKGTRRFAKRQISWFKRFPNIEWLELNGTEEAGTLAERLLPDFFG